MATKEVQVSERESRKVAEASRETEWKQPSFMREMFLGNFRLDTHRVRGHFRNLLLGEWPGSD